MFQKCTSCNFMMHMMFVIMCYLSIHHAKIAFLLSRVSNGLSNDTVDLVRSACVVSCDCRVRPNLSVRILAVAKLKAPRVEQYCTFCLSVWLSVNTCSCRCQNFLNLSFCLAGFRSRHISWYYSLVPTLVSWYVLVHQLLTYLLTYLLTCIQYWCQQRAYIQWTTRIRDQNDCGNKCQKEDIRQFS